MDYTTPESGAHAILDVTNGAEPLAVPPLPVEVVAPVAVKRHAPDAWQAGTVTITETPTTIVGAHHQRVRLLLANVTAGKVVYVSASNNPSPSVGAVLAAGIPPVELSHTDAVYAFTTQGSGDVVSVSFVAEYDTGRS